MPLVGPLLLVLFAAPSDQADAVRYKRAEAFLKTLHQGKLAQARQHFDDAMNKALAGDKLSDFWSATQKQFGAFQKIAARRIVPGRPAPTVALDCQFAKEKMSILVVFNKEDRIQGVFFQAPPAESPRYARKDAFAEEAVTVGAGGDWPLAGTLALPRGEGPFPAAVLLHGSGSHDRDETIGPNKPFRDLAEGLASRGVAVLRFTKRTKAYGAKLVKDRVAVTLQEETIDDALAAVRLLRKHRRIDPKRVFVLGHSLGAFAAPRVGQLDPTLRGLVMLAGNSRPLEDLIVEQYRYLFSLDGGPSKEQKEQLTRIEKQAAAVKSRDLKPDTPAAELLLRQPAPYWLALRAYDPRAVAAKLTMPLLILQGERDYQVTMEDFAGWKKALAGRKNVTFKSYPALNHLFLAGKGKSRPTEYLQPGNVAAEVVEDVAAWLKKH